MKNWRQTIWEFIKFLAVTALVVVPIRAYVAQPFIVSGASMVPTFQDGEYLIIDELSYHFRAPQEGEVVVFRYPRDPRKYFIKRIIGRPGETVIIKDRQVSIKRGEITIKLTESYIADLTLSDSEFKLGDDDYFVMGDNRAESFDSRSWGPLPAEFLTGRVLARLLPLHRLAWRPGQNSSQ